MHLLMRYVFEKIEAEKLKRRQLKTKIKLSYLYISQLQEELAKFQKETKKAKKMNSENQKSTLFQSY